MQNILVIKTGATGDVVRTTPLLRVLQGNIFWVTDSQNTSLFRDDLTFLHTVSTENFLEPSYDIDFDLVINLEENEMLAKHVSTLTFKKLVGVSWNHGDLCYSDDSAPWFDMSLISRFGKSKADDLKKINTLSYQDFLFQMVGIRFSGEKYFIHGDPPTERVRTRIGIETRAGGRWPNKGWYAYDKLRRRLVDDGFDVINFEHRENIRDYLKDIRQCDLLICGDTLAMHIALAYQIPCIALFNCTSAAEIFEYGTLKKIVSPFYSRAFYQQHADPEVIHSIPLDRVYHEVKKMIFLISTEA